MISGYILELNGFGKILDSNWGFDVRVRVIFFNFKIFEMIVK